MYKFFVNNEQIDEDEVIIIGDDVNHIKNVLRLQVEDKIQVCDKNNGVNYRCDILEYKENSVKCKIKDKILETTETKTHIHIFQGLPKADKFEWIIEKCTELGVKEITPVIMKRTVVKFNEKDKVKKVDRWKKIAEVAAKQSKRDKILILNNITNFKNIFENIDDYDIVLVAYENEVKNSLKTILKEVKNNRKNILKVAVLIGPEGGIDSQEIDKCKNNGFLSISLGKTILRTETAPIVVSSNILYELED